MWRLIKNPVYVVTCLGACMELMIVSGFVVFLPKYLETQFSLGKSQASMFTGKLFNFTIYFARIAVGRDIIDLAMAFLLHTIYGLI